LQKQATGFVMSVRPPPARPHRKKSAPTGRIFTKIDIELFFENLSKNSSFNEA
jgi:hypothetical protein